MSKGGYDRSARSLFMDKAGFVCLQSFVIAVIEIAEFNGCDIVQKMIIDSDIVPECIVRPGSFGGLMALYESNYLRLVHLLGTTRIQDCQMRSHSREDQDLFLSVESSTRYTLDLRMTYLFDEPDGCIAEPDLCIRVYHDARMTEVVSWAARHRHVVLRELHGRTSGRLGRRWSRNMVLSKWLDFLLDRAHSFTPVGRYQEPALA